MKKILGLLPRIALGLVFVLIMYVPPQEETNSEQGDPGEDEIAPGTPTPSEDTTSGETPAEDNATIPTTPLEVRPGQGLMVDTGSKIVNLVDPSGRRYLRVGIVLEFAPTDFAYYVMEAEEKNLFLEHFNQEINAILPVINDIIITKLSTQTFESVYTAEGKEALRQMIMDTINKQLPEQHVIFVYFTEFVVQ